MSQAWQWCKRRQLLNLARRVQVYMTDEHLVIVMEYAANGQLAERIDTSGPLQEDLARRLYRQLLDGMAYSHAQVGKHASALLQCLMPASSFAACPWARNVSSCCC